MRYVAFLFAVLSTCTCFPATLRAQTDSSDALLRVARHYVATGNLDAAITEYYRHLFLFPTSESSLAVNLELALACRDAGEQQACIRAFGSAMEHTTSSEERARVRIELADSYLLFDQPLLAQLTITRVLISPPGDVDLRTRMFATAGIAAAANQQWAKAHEYLTNWARQLPNHDSAVEVITKLLQDTSAIPHRDPALCMIMSGIIPGSGQIYCGEIFDGLNALALNAALVWSLASQIQDKSYATAALAGMPLLGRYYMGNLDHAKRDAHAFNERARSSFTSRIITAVAELK